MGEDSRRTYRQYGILHGAVTPGASFGPHGEGYVRFALVLPPEKIRDAVEAIQKSGL